METCRNNGDTKNGAGEETNRSKMDGVHEKIREYRCPKFATMIDGIRHLRETVVMSFSVSAKESSKTLVLVGFGGYDKLKIEQRPMPRPSEGEVLVNIRASGINFAELMCRQGSYDRLPKLPAVLGLEASGIVIQVGPGVTNLKEGQRIVCMQDFGLWTEYAAVKSSQCIPIPDSMSFEEAAAIPVNYITAHQMLFDCANLRANMSVLVHMAAGGVGTAVAQLCKIVPNVTVFGTASASKHDVIRKHGVHHPIDYRTANYVDEVTKLSPEGVDIVLDPLNGPDAVKGYNLLKPMGKIVHFGAANVVSGPKMSLWSLAKVWLYTRNYSPLWMLGDNKGVFFYHLGHMAAKPNLWSHTLKELIKLCDQGKFKPIIDSVWSFDEVGPAMARMHDRKNIGKVILVPHKGNEK